jgi:hypothetical protein
MIQCTLEYLIPKDEEAEETYHHKRVRILIEKHVETEDDKDFNTEEIRQKKMHQEKTASQEKS